VTPPGCGPLILVVALWEHDETPKDAVTAGFRAFSAELQAAVAAHLLDLNSSDPQVREQAIAAITKRSTTASSRPSRTRSTSAISSTTSTT
jgi:hypothetical protein